MRIIAVIFAIMMIFAIPALLFGDVLTELFSAERIVGLLRDNGISAALLGIAVLCSNIVLPAPAHMIMAGFGLVYGWLVGGLLASIGSFLSGTLAYWLCRLIGQKAALRIAGEKDMHRMQHFFERFGLWAIVLSRWMPIAAEVVACLAGVTNMRHARFLTGNFIGSTSVGFFCAAMGYRFGDTPQMLMGIATFLPLALLPIVLFVVTRTSAPAKSG